MGSQRVRHDWATFTFTLLTSLSSESPLFFFLSFYYQTSQLIKNLPAMWETWIQSLGWEDPLEKGIATHCGSAGKESACCWAYTLRKPELNTCTPMFITALFIIARTWKLPRCPSADKWIRKLWYIYTMEYYSAVKKNAFESVLMRWMKMEPIIQSEVSQKEKHQYSILMHIYGI